MTMRLQPFSHAECPDVAAGDLVLCRTATDEWVTILALDRPRYDTPNALDDLCWLSVRGRPERLESQRREGFLV